MRSIPRFVETFEKLGIPLEEQKLLSGVAVDAVFDSVSVATTFRQKLAELGIIFCSFSEAVQQPSRARAQKHLGSVVPHTGQLLRHAQLRQSSATARSPTSRRACAVRWSSSTYFRINATEYRAVRADADRRRRGRVVSATSRAAPRRCATRTSCTLRSSSSSRSTTPTIKYSTVQNWYPGDKNGKGGIYNFVTKRGKCAGANSKITWTQVETGSAITWKYPSCILQGDNSVGEFYSVATTNNWQQADTGTKMIHIGKNTQSTIVSKGISAGHGQNTYRGAGEDRQERDTARATTRSATRCSSATSAAPTRSRISTSRTRRPASSTRPRRRRSARTRSSIAGSAACRPRTPST